jgi:hypothetical protein
MGAASKQGEARDGTHTAEGMRIGKSGARGDWEKRGGRNKLEEFFIAKLFAGFPHGSRELSSL